MKIAMRKINDNNFIDAEDILSAKHGEIGSGSRNKFDVDARAYYYGVILRDRRKELKMTQQQVADNIGTQRSYVERGERGETDIQLSTFFRFLSALRLSIDLQAI